MINLDQVTNYLVNIQEKVDAREKEKNLCLSRDLPASNRVFIQDSREPYPYYFQNAYKHCLSEGDYTINGYEGLTVVERKHFTDFINSLIHEKDRFHKELERLRKYEAKCIVVEENYSTILSGLYRSQVHPNALEGLSHSIEYRFDLPVFFLENFQTSNIFVYHYLVKFANKKENEKKGIRGNLPILSRFDDYLIPLEQTIISLSLDGFIEQVTNNKEDFKKRLAQINLYRSKAVVIKARYSDLLNSKFHHKIDVNLLNNIVFSLIIDYSIPVYFLETDCISQRWIEKHLSRYVGVEPKIKKERKKR